MKLFLASDLHPEFGKYPYKFPQSDVAILAGDSAVIKRIYADDMKFEMEDFYKKVLDSTNHVLVIAGNHEYYHGGTFLKSLDHYREFLNAISPRITFLEKDHKGIDGVLFIGATLWTDFNKEDPISMFEIQRGLNDYRVTKNVDGGRLLPRHVLEEHKKTLEFYSRVLAGSQDRIVMISHHAPSKRSLHPRYENDYHINGAYSSDLEYLMQPRIKYWFHGHTHDSFNYEVNGTKVMSNPMGYLGYGRKTGHENDQFNPNFIVEV